LKNKWFKDADLENIEKWTQSNLKTIKNEKASCQKVDHRSKMGSIRNQQELGWCYAYGLAEILSFKIGKTVSAPDLALTSQKNSPSDDRWIVKRVTKKKDSEFSGGMPDWLFEFAKTDGVCNQQSVDESDSNVVRLKARLDQIEQQKLDKKCNLSEVKESIQSLFPLIDISKALKIYSESNYYNYLTDLFEEACKPRIKLPQNLAMKVKSYSGSSLKSRNSVFKDIENNLSNSGPALISIDSKILGSPRGQHAMIIAGRQWNEKMQQCDYILRNSWGKDSCAPNQFIGSCDNGDPVVSKFELLKNISTHYIVE